MHHLQLHRSLCLLLHAEQFERLVDRHLRILIALEQEQRRVVHIHMKNGTGQAGQHRHVLRLGAQQ